METTGQAKVLLIANNFPPVQGGSSAVYANLARAARGRVMVLAPRISYVLGLPMIGWREHDHLAPYKVTRLALLRTIIGNHRGVLARCSLLAKDMLIRARVIWELLHLVRIENMRAVCVGELLASNWIIQLLSYLPKFRVVVYVHGEEITTVDNYDPHCTRRRRALQAADRIIVVSRFTRRAVLDLIGDAEADRVIMIENGVDTTKFHPKQRCPDLQSLYQLNGEFVFITVCRLLEKKGVDYTLMAFAKLLADYPGTRYLIVGTGPYEQDLRKLSADLGISHAVVFAGSIAEDEMADHYRLADVFVMPNRALPNGDTEGFGVVFLEANGCGLPVIGGRDGGTSDAIEDGVNGLLVDGHLVQDIYEAMIRLRENTDLRAELARNGLEAAKRADWREKADKFIGVCLA